MMRMRRLHFNVCCLSVLTGTEWDTDAKNVDYAAYEYNVCVRAVQCNHREGEKKNMTQNNKEARDNPIG